MILIGLGFIFLAIRKGFEPLLLVPIGFGILIGNIPYDVRSLSVGVYDGPVDEHTLVYYSGATSVTIDGVTVGPWQQIYPPPPDSDLPARRYLVKDLVERGLAVMVNPEAKLVYNQEIPQPGVIDLPQGRQILALAPATDHRYPSIVSLDSQNPWRAGVFWWLFRGVAWGFFPPLIFLGVGALTDFGPLLAQPRTLLLGAAAQVGIFGALLAAMLLGFTEEQAASIGIIGGADGPTSIFVCTQLAPDLLGAVALAAYSYMALVPVIQPPIMRLLTTPSERRIRMAPPREVTRTMRIIFPIVGFLLTAFIANGALPLLGMLFFGNLLRESLVTERLAKTASTAFVDIITILLGVTVGAKTQASNFLTPQTIKIFILGVAAFAIATAAGVLLAKLMNRLSRDPVNPLIGAAGVSAVPMAARVVQRVAQEEDPQNFVLMQAMGPNVAGVIGSAVAAGVLLSRLQG
ncbi:MAG: sodium ion-translocating decarboxylase subunit beta [Phycisphaerae bacterium]